MFVIQPGNLSSPRSLGAVVRAAREAERKELIEAQETRKEAQAPASDSEDAADGETPEEAIERLKAHKYPDVSYLDEVFIRFRGVSSLDFLDCSQRIRSSDPRESTEAVRELMRMVIGEVSGLSDDNGPIEIKAEGSEPLHPDKLRILEAVGLDFFSAILDVCKMWPHLGAEQKKTFGAVQPSTSASSIATGAVHPSGSSEDAMGGAASLDGGAQNTRRPPAPGEYSSATLGSERFFQSTTQQGGA